MKILITGIDGFTGKYLEEFFMEKNFEVYGTVLSACKQNNHFICNILNKLEIMYVLETVKPDYIIHLAAISFVGEENTSMMYDVNVIGTQNILDSVLEISISVKKIIIASSATVYGNQNKEVLDELMCPKPVNHYGISKMAMEHMAQAYFDKLNIIITRPFNYSGVGQDEHFLIPKIVHHYKKNKLEIELGNLGVSREFNDISYVLEVYYKLMLSDFKSEIVNISSNKAIKLLEIINIMNKISGYSIKVIVNPRFVRKNEILSLSGSTKKMHSLIGPIRYTKLSTTLKNMYLKV